MTWRVSLMGRSQRTRVQQRLLVAGLALGAMLLTAAAARAERRAPYGIDPRLLETQVRETIERRITPLLEQMAPGQVELKYVDVRVAKLTEVGGGSPGFEEAAPGGTEFVAQSAEVSLALDAKLPAPFRKDLKNLIKNRLESIGVKIDITESVMPFPTPRPQPTVPPELAFRYPPMPQMPAQQPAAAAPAQPAAGLPVAPTTPPVETTARIPIWLAVLGAVLLALIVLFIFMLLSMRRRLKGGESAAGAGTDASAKLAPTAAAAAADHLPEVRRALREDR